MPKSHRLRDFRIAAVVRDAHQVRAQPNMWSHMELVTP